MPKEELIELFRSQDVDVVKQVISILDEAGIAYHLIEDEGGFDLTAIGSEEATEKIINIQTSDHEKARAALEADSLNSDLPEGHHLLLSTDDELAEIINHASEWSPFDVAHARKLLEERGFDIKKLAEDRNQRIALLKKGKPAPRALVILGWIFSILGGVIGIAVAWSLCHTKDKTPDGEFHRYDEASRAIGEKMLKVGATVLLICLIVRFAF